MISQKKAYIDFWIDTKQNLHRNMSEYNECLNSKKHVSTMSYTTKNKTAQMEIAVAIS